MMNLLLILDIHDIARREEGLVMLDHLPLMVLDALLIAVFFSFLWKRERAERAGATSGRCSGRLVLGAIALGWLMYPFPRS